MAGIAYNGSTVNESTKSNHVSYDVYTWQLTSYGYCYLWDKDGKCIAWTDDEYGWVYSHKGNTNAKITSNPIQSSGNVYVNGNAIAKVGDKSSETWKADPSVPSSTSSTDYRNISPASSGSGNGSITGGNSSNVYVNGELVAIVGSEVTTHLSTKTTIKDGSTNVFIN